MKPTIGRIVHFVSGGAATVVPPGDHYAAVITHVWSDACVNLFVFPKGGVDDDSASGVKTSVVCDVTTVTGHSWHWPERE